MKILSTADWHINLHKKKIPYLWQVNRYELLFSKILELEKTTDITIVAGDIFDKKPESDEVALFLTYLNRVKNPTILTAGNHESTSRGKTFLEHFVQNYVITNPNIHLLVENSRIHLGGYNFCIFPYGSVQTNQLPEYVQDDILVTHIRGEVPPHITAEYDFEKLRPWKLVLLGDLHFNHKHGDYAAYYPGSPLNTTFDRDDSRQYGVDIIEMNSIDDYNVRFVDLRLPKLIRRTVVAGSPLTPDDYDHVVYEVTGSIDQLASIERSELLDKKLVSTKPGSSTIELKDKSLIEELELYLKYIKVTDSAPIINEFKLLGIQ